MHIWRQADCLSFAYQYFSYDNSIFEPKVLNLGPTGNGKTGSDFPIIFYLIGLIWKIVGVHESIFKGLTFCISLLGFTSMYGISKHFIKNNFIAILIPLFILTSPVYVYYSNSYLMNMYSLNLSLIAWYAFISFIKTKKTNLLLLTVAIFVFASFLKITSLIHFIGFLAIIIAQNFKGRIEKKQFFIVLVFSFLGFLMLLRWIIFIKTYNELNISGMFLIGILPIWKLNYEEFIKIGNEIFWRKNDLFSVPALVISGISLLLLIWNLFKRKLEDVTIPLVILISGFVAFFLLFYQVLDQHDYYFTNWLLIVPLSILYLIVHFPFPNIKYRRIGTLVLVVFLIDGLLNTEMRYQDKFQGWKNEFYVDLLADYEVSESELLKVGVSKSAKIISASDISINATLYSLKREGWTDYNLKRSQTLNSCKKLGATHLIVHSNFEIKDSEISSFMKQNTPKRLGKLSIYELIRQSD